MKPQASAVSNRARALLALGKEPRTPYVPSVRDAPLGRLGISIRDLLPRPNAPDERANRGHESAAASTGGLDRAREGASHWLDLRKEGPERSLMADIHRRAEARLAYPAELKDAMVAGAVETTLCFRADGSWDEEADRPRLEGDRYLRVVVARTLRSAFPPGWRNDLPRDFRADLRFRFAILEEDDVGLHERESFALGRQLTFFRVFHHSKLQWELGPLHGLGPLLSLDLLWAPRKIGEALKDRAQADPLSGYREDPAW